MFTSIAQFLLGVSIDCYSMTNETAFYDLEITQSCKYQVF